jgi:HlyD family secretion protein
MTDPEPALVFGDLTRLRVRAEIDEHYVAGVRSGQTALIYGRGLGRRSYHGRVAALKTIMGRKTMFSRAAAERKDVDVLQVFIETDEPLDAPIGLEVDLVISQWSVVSGDS